MEKKLGKPEKWTELNTMAAEQGNWWKLITKAEMHGEKGQKPKNLLLAGANIESSKLQRQMKKEIIGKDMTKFT